MDIRFLKGLTPNVGYLFPKHQTFSPTPCLDIISIGIGQIIRNHAIYVPIHGLNSPYHIKKVVCQDGGSNMQSNLPLPDNEERQDGGSYQPTQPNLPEPNDKGRENDLNIPTSNSKKRKMDDAIKIGFQYPVIRTKTLKLATKNEIANKNFKFRIV